MDCKTCKDIRRNVARNEGEAWRQHHIIKWLIIVIAIEFVAMVASNGFWIMRESNFKTVEEHTEYKLDSGDGGNAVVNENGSVNINGES